MMDVDFHHRRFMAGKSDRDSLNWIYQECYAYTYPIRGARWSTGGARNSNGGVSEASFAQEAQARLLDETGTDSCRILSSALKDGGMPATSQWFLLEVDDADSAGDVWLDKSSGKLWKLIHASNFDSVVFEAIIDLVAAGQCVLYIDEAIGGGFRFEQWDFADCVFWASQTGGRVDTIYREFTMTAEQAVTEYGSRVSKEISEAAKITPTRTFTLVWCIYPRAGDHGPFALTMPFASVVYETGAKNLVKESGYNEFPCVVPRWMLIPGSQYAIGPTYDALPAMRQLNKTIELQILGLEVHAGAGTYKAVDDGILNPHNLRLGNRSVIVVGDMGSIEPLAAAGDLKATLIDIERLQKQIRKVFMADALEPSNVGPAKTATEIQIRVDLIRQQLGPLYGRMHAEMIVAVVERCYALAMRAGALGMPPDSLRGREYRVKASSPLARAQQLVDVQAIDSYLQSTMALDAQMDPSVLDNIDLPKANRMKAERMGVPLELLRDETAIAQMQAQRAKAQAAQQAEAAMGIAAQAKDQGQPTMSAVAADAGMQRMQAAQ